jgi:hypothetical protein
MAQAALGALELLRDDLAQARVLLRQCRDTARRIGAPGTLAVTACMQGFAARAAADVTAASKQFRFALRGGHAIGDSFIMTYSLEGLAWAARVQGNPARGAPAGRRRRLARGHQLTDRHGPPGRAKDHAAGRTRPAGVPAGPRRRPPPAARRGNHDRAGLVSASGPRVTGRRDWCCQAHVRVASLPRAAAR